MITLVAIPFLFALLASARSAAEQTSPETRAALERLKEGHARYLKGRPARLHADAARRAETSTGGQHPFAAVLSCSDSRVPVEILFDVGIGDLFVVRVPGNVCRTDEIGAIEYAVEHLGVPLCVVLGHTQCGAVGSVAQGHHLRGNLARLVSRIPRVVELTKERHPGIEGQALIDTAARVNVGESILDLVNGSNVVRARLKEHKLDIVGAQYDVSTGAIEWLADPAY